MERAGTVIMCASGKQIPRGDVQLAIASTIHANHVGRDTDPPCFMCRTDARAVTLKLTALGVITTALSAVAARTPL